MTNLMHMDMAAVQNGIKRGFGIEGFCAKYDCTESELRGRIMNLSHRNGEGIMKEIEKSARKNKKNKGNSLVVPAAESMEVQQKAALAVETEKLLGAARTEQALAATLGLTKRQLKKAKKVNQLVRGTRVQSDQQADENIAVVILGEPEEAKLAEKGLDVTTNASMPRSEASEAAPVIAAVSTPQSAAKEIKPVKLEGKEAKLVNLHIREQKLLKELQDAKDRADNLEADRRRGLEELQALTKELADLEAAYREKSERCDALIKADKRLAQDVEAATKEVVVRRAALDETRELIAELEVVTICLSSDGSISILDGPTVELSDKGVDELFPLMIMRGECENLTVREVRSLTRMLCIIKNVEHRTEVLFDDDRIGSAYESLKDTKFAA